MFRNGLTAARRPVISQSLGAAQHNTTTAATAVAVNNFVCKLCQTKRSAHDGPRKDKKKDNKTRKQETFAEQVKRLEQHVQMMERNYVEMLRKRAQEQVRSTEVSNTGGNADILGRCNQKERYPQKSRTRPTNRLWHQ